MLYEFDEEGKPKRFSPAKIKSYRDKLKKVFPYSFDVENPRTIKIELHPRYKKSLPRYRAKITDAPIGRKEVGTKNLHAPSIEKVREDGIGVEYVFSPTSPTIKFGEKWKPASVNLAKQTSFDPTYDLELLIFLFFFSCEITNGERAKSGDIACVNAHFNFVMPEQVAANKIANIRRNREMEDLITNKGTCLSYEDLCKVASVRGIATSGIEDDDRANIYHILSDESAWLGFKRVVEDVVGVRKNTADMSEINEKVTAGMTANVLRYDEKANVWNLTSTKGKVHMEVCKGEGTTDKARKFALIEYLKKDTAAMEKLNELLPDAVPA